MYVPGPTAVGFQLPSPGSGATTSGIGEGANDGSGEGALGVGAPVIKAFELGVNRPSGKFAAMRTMVVNVTTTETS
jgi:hypothetical protein